VKSVLIYILFIKSDSYPNTLVKIYRISRVQLQLIGRPLASGFALRATTRQAARSTHADIIRNSWPPWPDIIPVALRANLKPLD